ncbi:MAG: hypothetical protein GY778_20925, partial [bacterium]|nr:hypothetical protein [bacterium]
PTRISFPAGATAHTLPMHAIAANSLDEYVLGAAMLQRLTVGIQPFDSNTRANFALGIVGADDGQVLLFETANATTWSGRLPATQNYLIRVLNRGPADQYALYLEIPITVTLDEGSTSVTYDGDFQAVYIQHYLLTAEEDQPPAVSLQAADEEAFLSPVGADRMPILRAVAGSTGWYGQLPATQDYTLAVVNFGTLPEYRLSITLPQRIRFAPGGTAATVQGQVAGDAVFQYVVAAQADQRMTVSLLSARNDDFLTIVGEDGVPMLRSIAEQTDWTGVLRADQDYTIMLVPTGGEATYSLNVRIPHRIEFPPGGDAASLEGAVSGQNLTSYLVAASAGQTMSVSLFAPG